MPSSEGTLYRERLHAPLWLWGLATLMAASLGIAYAAPFTPTTGLVVGCVAMVVLAVLLARSAAVIEIDAQTLRAGRAWIPVELAGRAHALDVSAAALRRGRNADPAAWMLLRGWIPTAVEIPIIDPEDDTPYWFVSSRHADALVDALNRAQGRASAGG